MIARYADAQYGVVALWQLFAEASSEAAVRHRLATGRLVRIHRGVYAVGHKRLTKSGVWMAAVLAGGPGAVLGERSAGALLGIRASDRTTVDVMVAKPRPRRPGIRFHRARLLTDEWERVDGIPVTTPARTLLDLASVLQPVQLERALEQAEILQLTSPTPLTTLLHRHRGRRGVATLRAALNDAVYDTNATREELEHRFQAFLKRFKLPRPIVNAPLDIDGRPIEVDCLWPKHNLIVELDSRTYHHTPQAFERDRARDRALAAAGYTVIRVTWRQLHREPEATAADLSRLLAGA